MASWLIYTLRFLGGVAAIVGFVDVIGFIFDAGKFGANGANVGMWLRGLLLIISGCSVLWLFSSKNVS